MLCFSFQYFLVCYDTFQTYFKYIAKGFRRFLCSNNIERFRMNLYPKIAKQFNCEICDYQCSKQSEWKKHTLTNKHINRTKLNHLEQENSQKSQKKFVCECGKEYPARNSLWYHKKKCSIAQGKCKSNTNDISVTDIDKELLIKMLLKNSDVMDKMIEMMPQLGNNSHNTNTNTNSHNTNNFNIQMFLNDHCKNAMNLTDFIQSLPITSETYDSTIENGLTKTITNMMLNGLNDLDILERPIHCTDASRKTLYIKENDNWEKDNELLHILKGIKELSLKQRTMIIKWKNANPGWRTDENLQSKMTNLVFNSMTQIESDEKETGKIIRSISKKVYLDNETKQLYI